MKPFFEHKNLRVQLEVLNIAIGTVLILISLVYIFRGEVDYAASWFIFGCMYMVMDKYWPCDRYTALRIRADILKYLVNVAALAVSLAFLIYIL